MNLNELAQRFAASTLPQQDLSTLGAGTSHTPAPSAALYSGDSPASLYQAELITTRELATLAASLAKAKSEDKQTVGRALFRAIKGEVWAGKGQRNVLAFKIAAECVERYPNLDPGTVAQCFSAAVSNAQQSQGSKMTVEAWAGMLERIQDERQARLNMVAQVAPLETATGLALQEKAKQVAASAYAPETLALEPFGELTSILHTLVIKADGQYYLRNPHETHYRWRLRDHEALRLELARQFGVGNASVVTRDGKGEALPMAELLEVYGSNAHRIVHDYTSERVTWDAGNATLHVGLPSAVPAGVPDPQVHEWLFAIAGSEFAVIDLYDWISASARAWIARPASALVLVGPANAGKGLFVRALAATWGVLPVKLANSVERFNGALLTSPVWHCDERMPRDLNDAAFRELVQERERLVEPKGREKVELHGCGRIVFTLNEPEDFKLSGIEGPSAMRAVQDRICYYDFKNRPEVKAAVDALMVPGLPGVADIARVASHFRWIQENYTPRQQRFLGAQSEKKAVRDFVVSQVGRAHAGVYEALIEYLRDPKAWEVGYHPERRAYDDGMRFPIVTQYGCLWVWTVELAKKLGHKDTYAVRQALKTLRTSEREVSFCSRKHRAEYWEIDLDQLVLLAGVSEGTETWGEVIKTVAADTRGRFTAYA